MESAPEQFKIILIGDPGVGKTALTNRCCHDAFLEECDSFFDSQFKQMLVSEKPCRLEIFDLPCDPEFLSLANVIAQNSDGCIFVYDCTNRSSFHAVTGYVEHYRRLKDASKLPIVIASTKSDLIDEKMANGDDVVSAEEGREFAKQLYAAAFVQTSAKDGYNVDELFSTAVECIRSAPFYFDEDRPRVSCGVGLPRLTAKDAAVLAVTAPPYLAWTATKENCDIQ